MYPLFVETGREMEIGRWLEAGIGELVDPTHVKSRLGPLALRPGFHSTEVPFVDWIGKKQGGMRFGVFIPSFWKEEASRRFRSTLQILEY